MSDLSERLRSHAEDIGYQDVHDDLLAAANLLDAMDAMIEATNDATARTERLKAELTRVRGERDRAAQWMHYPAGPDVPDVIHIITHGSTPAPALRIALAEHDRRAEGGGS